MKEKIYRSMIELTNGKQSSLLLKKLATSALSKKFIQSYTKVYEINIEEVSKNMENYKSLHEFFTRSLKEGVRPVAQGEKVFTSPVDAKIEAFGDIRDSMTLTVKNKPYSLEDLFGSKERAARYRNGKYIVFYLSPADYHRIHSPIDGDVVRQYVLGQKSYPVNQLGLTYGKKPISHNYRMISELAYAQNRQTALIKVGAMFVNSIELTNITTVWSKGEEVGYFTFGSTVVMLFEKDAIEFCENVGAGTTIRMGQAFANML
ncbi:phosphatidylserine decarboxylase [Lysinibacillus odysseyi]|uniref:phosphatidylserine decarboxylase n=1 Tax=Lysinibacillus odysseyi 34hs-1 = NBRC 100172 TaxID=1220589 RepID=A0A0A3J8X5_9BACI|nr:phosphatidylserine decarboxylase [Lysinibacillus odysseyi]KGR83492.1 phosphatidylserine decarboxylase [Lysinibacillus odysseyi 34hs-1 = NBRC 100172]